jgi:hypothetical protein
MARTTAEIKTAMTEVFRKNATISELYGLDPDKTFDEQFSKASIESILFYIVAFCMHTLEMIFDTHKEEVNTIIDNMLPHRAKWYRDKALNFMVDTDLFQDTDEYDTTKMTDEQIADAKVVHYATAVEEPGSSVLIIKIATGDVGSLEPLTADQATQFKAYINDIRDAGVVFNVINQTGDDFSCEVDVYYSPLFVPSDVKTAVKTAIQGYLNGLPFNGEYSNMALVDTIQRVEGVRVVEFKNAKTGNQFINAKITPTAGYFTYTEDNITVNLIPG